MIFNRFQQSVYGRIIVCRLNSTFGAYNRIRQYKPRDSARKMCFHYYALHFSDLTMNFAIRIRSDWIAIAKVRQFFISPNFFWLFFEKIFIFFRKLLYINGLSTKKNFSSGKWNFFVARFQKVTFLLHR